MTPNKANVWQISAGPSSRLYAEVFLKYGVALIGPGDAGPWRSDRDDSDFEGIFVRRFASEIEDGDVVLLRTGNATIAAVGRITGDYAYLNAFDDVNGWDLQHARRVRWYRLPKNYVFPIYAFGANPPRCSRVWNNTILDFADRFVKSPPTHWQTAELPDLPAEEPFLDKVPTSLQGIVARAADLVSLYYDRQAFGDFPTEDELVAHFVVPLMTSFGWPPERIAIKWRRIDVALFALLPRTPENCSVIIEAKRLGAGVEGALEQARGYSESLGITRDVVVTDGIRYRMFDGLRGHISVAYANLARLKQSALNLFERLRRV